MPLSEKDLNRFSLHNALVAAAKNDGNLRGSFEAEVSTTLARSMRDLQNRVKEHDEGGVAIRTSGTGSFLVPSEIFLRDLQVGSAPAGGFTVGTDVGNVIPMRRPKCMVMALGAQVFDNLKGNLSLPRQTLGSTLDWLGEHDACNEQDLQLGALNLVPHRLSGAVKFTKQLNAQTGGAIESFVRNDFSAAVGQKIDEAALVGSGSSNQPTGILNTSGIGSVTFGAAATLAKVCDLESAVAEVNGDVGSLGWATSPATRKKWRQKDRSATGIAPLWTDNNTVLGSRAMVSKNITTNQVIFGNFNDLAIAFWGPAVEVLVNPYSYASTGTVECILNVFTDVGVLRAGSFAASTDSGAQ